MVYFCFMCGLQFCFMKIIEDVCCYVEEYGMDGQVVLQVGLEVKVDEFCEVGGEFYVVEDVK